MKNALGVSLGICAAVYTYLALGVISVIGAAAIWGGFIAWGSYFTVGKDALSKNISANVFGAVLAGVAVILYGIVNAYVGPEISWAIAVGITVWALTIVPSLGNAPANVFGYAATFGFMLLSGLADTASVISLAVSNPIVTMSIAMIVGSIFGLISEKVAAKLS
ncbi:DUF1097 domain-containing protein [Methylophilaceae bacterium]|nr:DUF1097 domain-containing protein [Methylophilaceae bacterium]